MEQGTVLFLGLVILVLGQVRLRHQLVRPGGAGSRLQQLAEFNLGKDSAKALQIVESVDIRRIQLKSLPERIIGGRVAALRDFRSGQKNPCRRRLRMRLQVLRGQTASLLIIPAIKRSCSLPNLRCFLTCHADRRSQRERQAEEPNPAREQAHGDTMKTILQVLLLLQSGRG